MPLTNAPDLTQRPPRSPRVRLGGYAILPRMLDKGRATINGKAGEYNFDCPLDGRFLGFVGAEGAQVKEQLAQGKGDGEILQWINANAKFKRNPVEIVVRMVGEAMAAGEIPARSAELVAAGIVGLVVQPVNVIVTPPPPLP